MNIEHKVIVLTQFFVVVFVDVVVICVCMCVCVNNMAKVEQF